MPRADGSKSGGRQKGTPNKKTQDLLARLEELRCDPLELSAKIALGQELDGPHPALPAFRQVIQDMRTLFEKGEPITDVEADRLEALVDEHLMAGYVPIELRSKHIADLMQYTHPKRKAVEMTGANGNELIPSFDPSALSTDALRELVTVILSSNQQGGA